MPYSNQGLDYFGGWSDNRGMKMIENYIYMYHTDTFIVIPTFPDALSDTLQVNFAQSTPLARTAPIYSYQNSGPRTMQFSFKLQRELMQAVNKRTSNVKVDIGNDYVDTLIKEVQAIALPKYTEATKMVNPPIIAVRIGDDVFIKGIVQGAVTVSYATPIIPAFDDRSKSRYSVVDVGFTVAEIDPYDAESIIREGSFRGLNRTLERRIYRTNGG